MILAAVIIVSRNALVTSANAGNTNVISRGTKAKQASGGGDVMDECLAAWHAMRRKLVPGLKRWGSQASCPNMRNIISLSGALGMLHLLDVPDRGSLLDCTWPIVASCFIMICCAAV